MSSPSLSWQPLQLLRAQLAANLNVLERRDSELAGRLRLLAPREAWFIATDADRVLLARQTASQAPPHAPAQLTLIPNPLPPAAAGRVAAQLYPGGACTEPVLVAGLDQGWLWKALYDLESHTPTAPGHRPPLYFLVSDLERLWAVLHFHNWTALLADSRVRLFVGPDAFDRARRSMIEHHAIPWPKLSVTVDPSVWPTGENIDSLVRAVSETAGSKLQRLRQQLEAAYAGLDPDAVLARLRSSEPLRVMGITSRFTTFLQFSMRDWLAAFEQMGHPTRLVIERQDCELANQLTHAEACAEFRPDLILMIDHFRAELTSLPVAMPCVMWVQDRLPNIFASAAGSRQGPMDYALGYGRQECVVEHGYPRERFMPSMIGFNPARFAARCSDEELRPHACDVSFVSHATTPADQIVRQEIDRAGSSAEVRRFLTDILDRLRAIYDAGAFLTEAAHLQKLVEQSMLACGVSSPDMPAVMNLVTHKLNNSLFRHQAIAWLAEMDVNVHLYGRGWENHPRFARFARGVADNERQLAAIYQASRINLQVTPFGAVHQRVLDGLSAGGFFLLRYCTGDDCDLIYRELWQWCRARGIDSGERLFAAEDPEPRELLARIVTLTGRDPRAEAATFFLGLTQIADESFTRSPATLWEEDYHKVVFRTRDDLHRLVRRYLHDPDQRQAVSRSMHRRVTDTMSYQAISRRLLRFIASDLSSRAGAAAA